MSTKKNPEAGNLGDANIIGGDEDKVYVTDLSDTATSPESDIDDADFAAAFPDAVYDPLDEAPDIGYEPEPDDLDAAAIAAMDDYRQAEIEAEAEVAEADAERVIGGGFPTVDVRELVDIDIEWWRPLTTYQATAMTAWVAKMRVLGIPDSILRDRDRVGAVVLRIMAMVAQDFHMKARKEFDRRGPIIERKAKLVMESRGGKQVTDLDRAEATRQCDAMYGWGPLPGPLTKRDLSPGTIPTEVAVATWQAVFQPVCVDTAGVAHYDADTTSDSYGCHVLSLTSLQAWITALAGTPLSQNVLEAYIGTLASDLPKVHSEVGGKLVALNNGIFNYTKQEFRQFSSDVVFMSKSSVNWNPTAQSPVIDLGPGREMVEGIGPTPGTWEVMAWLKDLADGQEDIFTLFQQVMHAVLRPTYKWSKMVVLYSPVGNNGKGTYLRLLRALVGEDNAVTIPIERLGDDFGLSQLLPTAGRIPQLIASDESDARYLDKMATMKSLITQDTVVVNEKHKAAISLRWQGVIVQCMNSIPRTRDTGNSVTRRLIIAPFVKNFGAGGGKTIPEIPEIGEAFVFRSDVLEFLVRYVLDKTCVTPFTRFIVPEASAELGHEQQLDSDPVLAFWETFKDEWAWNALPSRFMYDLYLVWQKRVNPAGTPVSSRSFSNSLKTIVTSADDGWEWSRFRPGDRMDVEEPLIVEYGLIDAWGSHGAFIPREEIRRAQHHGAVRVGTSGSTPPASAASLQVVQAPCEWPLDP